MTVGTKVKVAAAATLVVILAATKLSANPNEMANRIFFSKMADRELAQDTIKSKIAAPDTTKKQLAQDATKERVKSIDVSQSKENKKNVAIFGITYGIDEKIFTAVSSDEDVGKKSCSVDDKAYVLPFDRGFVVIKLGIGSNVDLYAFKAFEGGMTDFEVLEPKAGELVRIKANGTVFAYKAVKNVDGGLELKEIKVGA